MVKAHIAGAATVPSASKVKLPLLICCSNALSSKGEEQQEAGILNQAAGVICNIKLAVAW